LAWHKKIVADGKCAAKVVPALRPDKALHIAQPGWNTYIKELGKVAGVKSIATIGDIRKALKQRLDYFESMGCRATDHALEYAFYRPATDAKVNAVIKKALAGKTLSAEETETYETALLLFLGEEYATRGWAMEVHFSALRNTNSAMYKASGT